MKLASGVAPLPEMLAVGVKVGLGTDGCASNNNLDIFQEMDTAAKLHKIHQGDPALCSAVQVAGMATKGGAAALGMIDEIGTLEPGKKADIIVLDASNHKFLGYRFGVNLVDKVIKEGRLVVNEGTVIKE